MGASRDFVVVVSGVPRSGTSLVMQMLAAGGFPVLTDEMRRPDANNPRGYFEFEPVKALPEGADWLPRATGRAVKVIHTLVPSLPEICDYRVVLIRRDLAEVVASQEAMLAGRAPPGPAPGRLAEIYARQLVELEQWIAARPAFGALWLDYDRVLAEPRAAATALDAFLGAGLDTGAMTDAVDPGLRHQPA